jgi:cytochrome P450
MTTSQEPRPYPFGEPERLEVDPTYLALRETEPVSRVRLPYGGDAWLVTRYADVKTVFGDPRFSRAAVLNRDDVPRSIPIVWRDVSILSLDPPDHSRLRKLVAKAFTARRTEQLRVRAQEVVDGLLDAMAEQGRTADLIEAFAMPLTITIICELLGVPYADRTQFRGWSEASMAMSAVSAEEITEANENLGAYIAEMVAKRRHEPTDDVLGTLVAARDDDDRLTEQELVTFGANLLVAGHETTANQIGNFVYTLLTNPERLAELRAEPELLAPAIEELLRITPIASSGGFPRVATEDVVLSGVPIAAGEAVFTGQCANRDPEVFDRPSEIDFHRQANPHVAFGHGPHHCLGAPLARMELQVAIGTLLRRFPSLELAVAADDVEFQQGRLVRGLRALPVRW